VDHFLSRARAPALVVAKVIRQLGFRYDGLLPPDAWLPSDHLPVVAEVK
jgi:hypothetical protein